MVRLPRVERESDLLEIERMEMSYDLRARDLIHCTVLVSSLPLPECCHD
jgi:hypothetical protein